jgi:hypothetical protein
MITVCLVEGPCGDSGVATSCGPGVSRHVTPSQALISPSEGPMELFGGIRYVPDADPGLGRLGGGGL